MKNRNEIYQAYLEWLDEVYQPYTGFYGIKYSGSYLIKLLVTPLDFKMGINEFIDKLVEDGELTQVEANALYFTTDDLSDFT